MIGSEGESAVSRIHAATDSNEVGPCDLVIVLVKSFDTEQALRKSAGLFGPETVVMSLQNGLGHEDALAEVVGRRNVIAGKTYVGGVMLEPGVVIAGVQGKETLIGELDGSLSLRVQAIADVFNRAGLVTVAAPDIMSIIWDKLLVNVATGALAAITRLPYGPLYDIAEIHTVAVHAVAEAIAVAEARGISLSITEPEEAWRKAAEGLPPNFKTSMLQSLEKGSVTEIDFINGAVVAEGRRLGIATPYNETLVACIKGIEASLH